MVNKNNNPLFEPLPDQRGFPDLKTGFENADVTSGKTSDDVFYVVFGKPQKKRRTIRIVRPEKRFGQT